MKLVYFTSMRYPADNGMKIYARELANGFTKILKNDFLFVVANNFSQELKSINYLNLRLSIRKFRSPFFFFWIPYFVFLSRKEKDLVFFSNDTYLLTFLIFWKSFFRLKYRICSDWHHLHYNRREKFIIQPEDVYGSAKASMEVTTRVLSNVHGFKYVIIRPHNVYGPRQNLSDPYRNVIGIFLNRLLNNKSFYIYGDGKQKRALSYIDDVVPPMISSAFNKKCEGKTINIGGEEPFTLNQLAKIILEEFFEKKDTPKEFIPIHLPDRPQEVKYAYSKHDLARKLMGFEQKTSLKDGLREMIIWAKKMGPQEFVYLKDLDLENDLVPKTWSHKLL